MKLKHSKLKNTGIIFELLVRQVTADTLENKNSKALDIIKKYFNHTELAKEYKIYKTLSKTRGLNEVKANILINSVLESQRKLNQVKLKTEKYKLVSEIKENYDLDNFFKAKIDNYKLYASSYLLFESDNSKDIINPTSVADFKYTLFEHVTTKNSDIKDDISEELNKFDRGTRHLIYQKLVERFNEKYDKSLSIKQKALLREYINNITTTNKLREYINLEFVQIKSSLMSLSEGIKDPVRQVKVKQVADIVSEIPANKTVTEEHIINLFNYYQLVDEINGPEK
jgi:hypothetical protein